MERHDVAGLLAQLTGEGMLDSAGSFTLDSNRAWEKARNLRFSDPGQYLRCIYRGVVLGEASEIDVYVDSDDTILSFDGPPLSQYQLRYLLASLYVEDNSYCARKLQQLAMGVHGSWGIGYQSVDVYSQLAAYRYLPDSAEPKPLELAPHLKRSNEIRMKRKFSKMVVARYLTQSFPEQAVFSKGLGWSAVTTFFNGGELGRNRCPQSEYRFDSGLPRPMHLQGWERAKRLKLSGVELEFSTIFDLNPNHKTGVFRLVVADVEVPDEFSVPECPGLDATVAVGPFLLDASQLKVVQNEDFQRLVNDLRLCWTAALLECCRNRFGLADHSALLAEALLSLGSSPLAQLPDAAQLCEGYWEAPLLTCLEPPARSSLKQALQAPRIFFEYPDRRCPGDLYLERANQPLLEAAGLTVHEAYHQAAPQVDFSRMYRQGENYFLTILGPSQEQLCFQLKARLLLLGKHGKTIAKHPLDGVRLVAEQSPEGGTLFLVVFLGTSRLLYAQAPADDRVLKKAIEKLNGLLQIVSRRASQAR